MKSLPFIAVLTLLVGHANAITLRIVGKDNSLLLKSEISAQVPADVGSVSISAFNQNHVPFEGSISGVSKIFGLGQDLEVVSDTEMKAYGWCFSIDGLVPETMPDQTPVTNSESVIEWYYAYAHYMDGNWTGQCVRD